MKAVLLLSGGIDSPVAGYLMKKKGIELIPVYFESGTDPEKNRKRAQDSASLLGLKKLWVVPHGKNLQTFVDKCEIRYVCVLCKRLMLRVASELGRKWKAEAIVMGDNLAQVASQTLSNLYTVSQASELPIMRPLIGKDKNEIIGIAKKIGTYDVSIQDVPGCPYVPDKPATAAELEKILEQEKKAGIGRLVRESVKNAKSIGTTRL